MIPVKVVDCVLERVESIMSQGILDCRSISQHISFYILGVALFEETFLTWSDKTLYEELLLMISKDACFWASYKFPPFWRKEYWRYQFLCTKLKCLTQDIIQKYGYNCRLSTEIDQNTYKQMKNIGKQAGNDTALFFGNMLSGNNSLQEEKKRPLVSDEEPFGDTLGVMFHGYLTITNLVCNILTRLALYPELQMKVHPVHFVSQFSASRKFYSVDLLGHSDMRICANS